MKNNVLILTCLILSLSCIQDTANKTLTYKNIIILSDLSSRINSKRFPHKDYIKIHDIIEYFKNECVRPGKKLGDKSAITFSTFSDRPAINIDLDNFKNITDKQSFINSTYKFKKSGLKERLIDFEDTVHTIYKRISNPGLDLISILMEKIENENIVKQNKNIVIGGDTTFLNYENHIYIFTDGYLEYNSSKTSNNKQFYFGKTEINNIRKYCVENKINITTALKKGKNLGLPAYRSSKNQYIYLHILESHERDKDTKFLQYENIKGLRDNEILEAVWRKWAKESGFKNLEWEKY
jgi:hypothetical protein